MPIGSSRITVTTTVAQIASGLTAGSWLLRNRGTVSAFLGGPAVTGADGYELAAGESVAVELDTREELHAITATGTTTLHALTR